MSILFEIPAWLGNIISALVGMVGTLTAQTIKKRRQARARVRQRLERLSALLAESKSLFRSQSEQRDRLVEVLGKNHPAEVGAWQSADGRGFDDLFYDLSPQFAVEERNLQAIIRGMTELPMRRVNQEMSDWLAANLPVRAPRQMRTMLEALNDPLVRLQLHLNEWHSKYLAVFAPDSRRSLVYLADEHQHGHGFPKDLEPKLKMVRETMA